MSVLEIEHEQQERPYSQDELLHIRNSFYQRLRLSDTIAQHKNCNHSYKVKENGKKFNQIIETNNSECGNCSVCWKLKRTPKNLKKSAEDLVFFFQETFDENCNKEYITFDNLFLEQDFYNWLYKEFNN